MRKAGNKLQARVSNFGINHCDLTLRHHTALAGIASRQSVASTLKLELRVGEMKCSEKILEKIVLDGFFNFALVMEIIKIKFEWATLKRI